jgi:hypothetical protein
LEPVVGVVGHLAALARVLSCRAAPDRYTELMNSIGHRAQGVEGSEGDEGGAAHGAFEGGLSEGGAFETESPVNYEEAALLELDIDGTDYRLDVGRAGTALCISTRPGGSWSWVFRGEARWQAGVLRCKAFDRRVLTQLSNALAEAAASLQS